MCSQPLYLSDAYVIAQIWIRFRYGHDTAVTRCWLVNIQLLVMKEDTGSVIVCMVIETTPFRTSFHRRPFDLGAKFARIRCPKNRA